MNKYLGCHGQSWINNSRNVASVDLLRWMDRSVCWNVSVDGEHWGSKIRKLLIGNKSKFKSYPLIILAKYERGKLNVAYKYCNSIVESCPL